MTLSCISRIFDWLMRVESEACGPGCVRDLFSAWGRLADVESMELPLVGISPAHRVVLLNKL